MLLRRLLSRPAVFRRLSAVFSNNRAVFMRQASASAASLTESISIASSPLAIDRVAFLLKHDQSIDAGVIALKSIMTQIDNGGAKLAETTVLDVFCKAITAVSGCAHPGVLLDAFTLVVSADNKLNTSLSRDQLTLLMDTFVTVALAQTDPKLLLAVLNALITQRLTVTAGSAAEFVTAYRHSIENSKQLSRRFKLQTFPDSAPTPVQTRYKVPELSDTQWNAAADAILSHVRPPVNSREGYALMAALAGRGKVKETFQQFDVYRELLKAEGVSSVLPEVFAPLALVCRVARHPNRAMKVLKWMERESIVPTQQTIEDVVITLCQADDVTNAASVLDMLLNPSQVESGRIASDSVIIEMMDALARNNETPQIIQLFEAAKLVNRLEDVDFCEENCSVNMSGFSPGVTATLLPYVLESMIDDIKDGASPLPSVARVYFSDSNKVAVKNVLSDKAVDHAKKKQYFVIKSDQFQWLLAPTPPPKQTLLSSSYLSTSDDDDDTSEKSPAGRQGVQDLTLDLPQRRSRSIEGTVTPSKLQQFVRQRSPAKKPAPRRRLSFYGDEVKDAVPLTPKRPQPPSSPQSPSFWTFYGKDAKGNTTSVPRKVVKPHPDSAFVEDVDAYRRRRR